jgi:hypothetical protein
MRKDYIMRKTIGLITGLFLALATFASTGASAASASTPHHVTPSISGQPNCPCSQSGCGNEYEIFWYPNNTPPEVTGEWLINGCDPVGYQTLQAEAWCANSGTMTTYNELSNQVVNVGDLAHAKCDDASGDFLFKARARFETSGTWGGWLTYWCLYVDCKAFG